MTSQTGETTFVFVPCSCDAADSYAAGQRLRGGLKR